MSNFSTAELFTLLSGSHNRMSEEDDDEAYDGSDDEAYDGSDDEAYDGSDDEEEDEVHTGRIRPGRYIGLRGGVSGATVHTQQGPVSLRFQAPVATHRELSDSLGRVRADIQKVSGRIHSVDTRHTRAIGQLKKKDKVHAIALKKQGRALGAIRKQLESVQMLSMFSTFQPPPTLQMPTTLTGKAKIGQTASEQDVTLTVTKAESVRSESSSASGGSLSMPMLLLLTGALGGRGGGLSDNPMLMALALSGKLGL